MSELSNAQIVGSGIAQDRNSVNTPAASHSAHEPHPIQGWTPDIIPFVLQEAIDKEYYYKLVPIPPAHLPLNGPISWPKRKAFLLKFLVQRPFESLSRLRKNPNLDRCSCASRLAESSVCRKASRRASSKKYRDRHKGNEQFKEEEKKRVKAWRQKNPGYWKRHLMR